MKNTPPENTGRDQAGRFRKGQSGNPAGKPRGARNAATIAAASILDGEAEALTRKAIELAKEGDATALRLVLERILPPRRDRPVMFDLPQIETAADAAKGVAALAGAVAAGDISPVEAVELAKLIDIYVRSLEASEFEARLSAIEQSTGQSR